MRRLVHVVVAATRRRRRRWLLLLRDLGDESLLDAGVSYLKSSGSFSIKVYDGPDIPLKGLSQLLLRTGLSFSLGH